MKRQLQAQKNKPTTLSQTNRAVFTTQPSNIESMATKEPSNLNCVCEGFCPRCSVIQPKVEVGSPSDHFEREADDVSARIMQVADKRSDTPKVSKILNQKRQQVQHKLVNLASVPEKDPEEGEAGEQKRDSSVHALDGHGIPLDSETRQFFEPRFDHNFSQVRIHHNTSASDLAKSYQAKAFTYGNHIVFNSNNYQPTTNAGRSLLAHELTHTVQQQGLHNPKRIQRHVDMPCPTGSMERITAIPKNRWLAANDAIEKKYKADHPNNSVLVGGDYWMGGDAESAPGLSIKGKEKWISKFAGEFRGISRQLSPDIIDFTERTIYEIKSDNPRYIAQGAGQLLGYYKIANAILMDIGLPQFNQDVATWYPPHVLPYETRADRKICTQATNYIGPNNGLILYSVLQNKDPDDPSPPPIPVPDPKTYTYILLLMLLMAAAKKMGKPQHPAVAALLIIVALSMGAKPSFGKGVPPDEALMEMLAQSGVPVDEELAEIICKDPALQKKLKDLAMSGEGSKEAAEYFHEALMELKDEMTEEELREVLRTLASMPGGDKETAATKEEIKQLLRDIKEGRRPKNPRGEGGTTGGKQREGHQGNGGEQSGEQKENKGGTSGGKGEAESGTALSDASNTLLSEAPLPVRTLFEAMTSATKGPVVTDDAVKHFLELVKQYELTERYVEELVTLFIESDAKTWQEAMATLAKALKKIGELPEMGMSGEGNKKLTPKELAEIKATVKKLAKIFVPLPKGAIRFTFNVKADAKPEDLYYKGATYTGYYFMEYNGTYIGGPSQISVISESINGDFKIKISKGAPIIDIKGNHLGYLKRPIVTEAQQIEFPKPKK